jgi:orotidine-5'-phosphate decarboxylase
MQPRLTTPLFFALDVDSRDEALSLAKKFSGQVGGYKLGPRLLYRYGASLVTELKEFGPIFVDNKYHDITSTMEAAVKASFEAGASFVTIHASCGNISLAAMRSLEKELQKIRPFLILSVTVLTNLDESTVPKNWKNQSVASHVQSLAAEVFASGLTGLVCSPFEVAQMKSQFPKGYFVTPGVRLEGEATEDQVRVMTPTQALAAGATALVMGRSILKFGVPKL